MSHRSGSLSGTFRNALAARARSVRRLGVLAVGALLLAGCGQDDGSIGLGTPERCGPGERSVVDAQGRRVCEPIAESDARVDVTPDVGGDAAPDTGGEPDTGAADTMPDPDTGVAQDTGADPDTAVADVADTGGDDTVAVDTMPDEDMGVVDPVTRFVAIGDVGEGSPEQYHVAANIGQVCGTLGGCQFGLLLGDNFYDSGVSGEDDAMFDTHFAQPYGPLGFPFYVVLGNHDLGGEGLGVDLDFQKGDYQVAYSQRNPQWRMPAKHYQFTEGPLWFAALNTTDVFFDQDDDQYTDVAAWLAQYDASGDTRWKIAFGHHPYISNGKHGNAGTYEGMEDWGSWTDIPRGKHVQDFMEDNVCGKFDVYICGHDHSLQDLHATCGTEFLISGAGAKTTEVVDGRNAYYYQAEATGFLIVEATTQQLRFVFYDRDGQLSHERSITR